MTEQERHDVFRALVAEQDARLPAAAVEPTARLVQIPLAEMVRRTYATVAARCHVTEARVRTIAALGVEENWIRLLEL